MTFSTLSRPQQARRPWRRWTTAVVLGGLGIFLWCLPMLATMGPVKDRILATIAARFGGRLEVAAVSLGWLNPIEIRALTAWDADGNMLLSVDRVSTEQTLVELLTAGSTTRKIRLEQPRLEVVWDATSSNWEQAATRWFAEEQGAEDSSSSLSTESDGAIELEIVQATISSQEPLTGQAWELAQLDATLRQASQPAGEVSGQFRGLLREAGQWTGELAGELTWQGEPQGQDATSAAWGSGQASLNVRGLPITMLSPILRRSAPSTAVAGRFTGTAQLTWSPSGEQILIEQAVLQGFELVSPELLGTDRLVIQQLQAGGRLRREGDQWEIAQAALTSELFSVNATGAGRLMPQPTPVPGSRFAELLAQGGYQVAAQIDLARLAQQLPATLHIRPGTQLTGGRLTIQLDAPAEAARRWNMRVGTENLVGMHGGREIRMIQPVQAELVARHAAAGWVVDNLTCNSSFLRLQGQGTLLEGRLSATADLSQLAAELRQFVDLGDVALGGRVTGQLDWRQPASGSLTMDGTLQADEFVFHAPNRLPWNEPRLNLQFHGSGTAEQNRLQRLDTGRLELTAGSDRLQAELLAAWDLRATDAPVALKAFMTGELATWTPRLERLVSLPAQTKWEGQLQGLAEFTASSTRWDIRRCEGEARGVRLIGAGWGWQEPIIKLTGTGVWNSAEQLWATNQLTVSSSALSLQAVGLQLRATPEAWQALGEISYRGDLARVSGVLPLFEESPGFRLAGDASGTVRLQPDGTGTVVALQADVKDFRYDLAVEGASSIVPVAFQPPTTAPSATASPAVLTAATQAPGAGGVSALPAQGWKPVWQESLLKFATEVRYEPTSSEVAVNKLEVAGSALSLGARGKVEELTGPCLVQLEGQVSYDLDGVSTRLRPWLTDQVRFRGRETRPFRFRGPLLAAHHDLGASVNGVAAISDETTPVARASESNRWSEINGATQLAWQSAEIAGFRLGPGQLDAELLDGIVEIKPLDLALNEGRLRLTPRVVLDHDPAVLQVARGPLLEQVRVTPDICRAWMKYVAPLVADATEAEGQLSVDLGGATVPLDQPQQANVEGTLKVHYVRVGPGPLARSLIQLAEQVRALSQQRPWTPSANPTTWLQLPAQTVAFRMEDQRVHHQGLLFQIDDVQVRTSGSVGLDQQLALEAEIPIRDEWVNQSPLLASLRGQTLKIPIRGTLDKPRLDERALANLTRQAVGGAVNRALENQINRGLEKLFGPPPRP